MIDLILCGPLGDCNPSAIPAMINRDRSAVSLMTRSCFGSTPTGRRFAPKKSSSRAIGRLIAFSRRLARALRVPFTPLQLRHELHVTCAFRVPFGLFDLRYCNQSFTRQHSGVVGGDDRVVEVVILLVDLVGRAALHVVLHAGYCAPDSGGRRGVR